MPLGIVVVDSDADLESVRTHVQRLATSLPRARLSDRWCFLDCTLSPPPPPLPHLITRNLQCLVFSAAGSGPHPLALHSHPSCPVLSFTYRTVQYITGTCTVDFTLSAHSPEVHTIRFSTNRKCTAHVRRQSTCFGSRDGNYEQRGLSNSLRWTNEVLYRQPSEGIINTDAF